MSEANSTPDVIAFAERCQHYAQEKSAWIASHPSADHKQIEAASRELAKKWDV
jgi:hypothetical protein